MTEHPTDTTTDIVKMSAELTREISCAYSRLNGAVKSLLLDLPVDQVEVGFEIDESLTKHIVARLRNFMVWMPLPPAMERNLKSDPTLRKLVAEQFADAFRLAVLKQLTAQFSD